MTKHESFAIEIPINDPEAMEKFQEAMDDYHDQQYKLVAAEAERLGIPIDPMFDIWYLRSRSRWTQEKEDYLIQLAREGKELPNVLAGDF